MTFVKVPLRVLYYFDVFVSTIKAEQVTANRTGCLLKYYFATIFILIWLFLKTRNITKVVYFRKVGPSSYLQLVLL